MKPAQKLLMDAAEYMEKHGFAPDFARDGGQRCMLGAIWSVRVDDWRARVEAEDSLIVVTSNLRACELKREGWNTQDAVAALRIAADLAA